MEKTQRGAVVPCAMGWNDVGSWQSLWQSADKDAKGNASLGNVVAVETTNSYIRSEGPAVAVLGMTDVAVVATKDAVLVTPRARTQDVKTLVAAVEKAAPSLAQDHHRTRRPWGAFESLAGGPQFQVKHITVLPGRSLSLQMHHHRAEHWIVVAGTAQVECDGVGKLVFPNESVYISKGTKHRLTNPGIIELHLIEVQSGDYLGEDDIIRFEDNYGRVEVKP
jgi:mannose-1-phosphate guanylyltransferase/mannose-6-phosphate isomerase